MKFRKLWALCLAFLLALSVWTPASVAVEAETTETVTVHKVVMNKTDFAAWDPTPITDDQYNGTQTWDQLKNLLQLSADHSAKEVAGVFFTIQWADGVNKDKYVGKKQDGSKVPVADPKNPGEGVTLVEGLTKADGLQLDTKGLEGKFKIVEVPDKSTYKGENQEQLTDSKAVPVEITLPLVNKQGIVKDAHVFPKNTEDKPEIDKNFAASETGLTLHPGVGAKYENYQANKDTINRDINKPVQYEVKTKIPARKARHNAHSFLNFILPPLILLFLSDCLLFSIR